jgi:hypothetical protein
MIDAIEMSGLEAEGSWPRGILTPRFPSDLHAHSRRNHQKMHRISKRAVSKGGPSIPRRNPGGLSDSDRRLEAEVKFDGVEKRGPYADVDMDTARGGADGWTDWQRARRGSGTDHG